MQAQEILLTPASVGLDIINKVCRTVVSPFDSRGLGERLARDHTANQIDVCLQEMTDRIDDREIVLLGAQHIVAVMARGNGPSAHVFSESSTESVGVAGNSNMHFLFPAQKLASMALPMAEVKLPSQR